jgi:hypothetical protein
MDTATANCQQALAQPVAVKGNPVNATGASCVGNTPSPGPATFSEHATGCLADAPTSCSGGVCVPATSNVCIYIAGMQNCPSSYPIGTVVYGGIDDTYACTTCTCNLAGARTCAPTVTFYTDSSCTSTLMPVPFNGNCSAFGLNAGSMQMTNAGSPQGGACAMGGGGTLTGNATGTQPTTVCCN